MRGAERRVRVLNETRGSVVADAAEVARGFGRRLRGLMGRAVLPEGGGMVLWGVQGVHTLFLRFPIDLLYVAADGRVLRVVERLAPYRVGPFVPAARCVVELPAGRAAASGTRPGDRLRFEPAGPG